MVRFVASFASVFVIVDPNTQIGRDWAWAFRNTDKSGNEDQIVLEPLWIYKCVDHGRVKGVGESWGGCRVLDVKKPG